MANPPQDDPEVGWIKRAQRGDGDAFEELVRRHERRVVGLVSRLIARRADVEDVAQEIFVKAYLAIRTFNFESSFGTWISRVAINHCYDHLRRARASRVAYYADLSQEGERALAAQADDRDRSGERIEERIMARDLAERLLRRAPPEDRVMLTLKELEQMSVSEIAEVLNLRESTVKVRLHRARKRMLEDLKRWRRRP